MLSDYFLVLARNYPVGVFTFCFVHMAYLLRVSPSHPKSAACIAATVAAGVVLYAIFAVWTPGVDPLLFLGGVYAALFAQNFAAHIRYCRRDTPGRLPKANRILMLAGLMLFALCDVHVLLFNLHRFLEVPQALTDWANAWIWVFYVPSQMLLALSAVRMGRAL